MRRPNIALAGTAVGAVCGVAAGQNMVANPGFESEPPGFYTQYFRQNPTGAGHYQLTTNPVLMNGGWVSATDHTPTGTRMMVVDGMESAVVWSQDFLVQPNSAYRFSYWYLSLDRLGRRPAVMQTRFRNNATNALWEPPWVQFTSVADGVWRYAEHVYYTGATTDVAVIMYDREHREDGNDFALDDLSFTRLNCVTWQFHPGARSVCEGVATQLSVGATGLGELGYQWRRDGVALVDVPGLVSGVNEATLRLAAVQLADAGSYDCVVSNGCGGFPSNPAALTVIAGGCRWHERPDGGGDAGDLPATAQVVRGFGGVGGIEGVLGAGDVDMYRIEICDPAAFSATTATAMTGPLDTQLFLFNEAGFGVACNDDLPPGGLGVASRVTNAFVPGPGMYYLAVSQYNKDVYSAAGPMFLDLPWAFEHPVDGPGAGGPAMVWLGASGAGGPYAISLTGACFATRECYANCDGSTNAPPLTVSDFACFLNMYAAGMPYANCDGSTVVPVLTVADFACFLNAFAAGCS